MKIFMYYWIGLTVAYVIYYAIIIVLDLNSSNGKKEETSEEFHAADEVDDEEENDSVIVDDPDAYDDEGQQPEEFESGDHEGAAGGAAAVEPTEEELRDAPFHNRVFTVYNVFMDDKSIGGSLKKALADNASKDKKHVTKEEQMKISRALETAFMAAHIGYKEPTMQLTIPFGD